MQKKFQHRKSNETQIFFLPESIMYCEIFYNPQAVVVDPMRYIAAGYKSPFESASS